MLTEGRATADIEVLEQKLMREDTCAPLDVDGLIRLAGEMLSDAECGAIFFCG